MICMVTKLPDVLPKEIALYRYVPENNETDDVYRFSQDGAEVFRGNQSELGVHFIRALRDTRDAEQ